MKKLSIAFAAVLGLSVAPLACVQAGPPKAAANFNASAGLGNEDQNELIEQLLDLLDPDAVQSGGLRDQDDEDRADPFDDLQDQHGKALGHEKEKGHEKKRHRAGSSSSGIAKGDFNGDGFADLAIGVPEKNTPVGVVNSGAVIVIYGSANGLTTTDPTVPAAQFWSQNTPGVPGVSHAGDHFGSALAAGDFNDDGISDLAIGAPDKIVAKDGVCAGVGAVFVIYGSPSGLTADTNLGVPAAQIWAIRDVCDGNIAFCFGPAPALAGLTDDDCSRLGTGSFGASLAWGDFDGDGVGDLAVGSPEEDLEFGSFPFSTKVDKAGAVGILFGVRKTATSAGGLSAAGSEVRHLGQDIAKAGDLFGQALAAGDFDGNHITDLAIGIPGRDIPINNPDNVIQDAGEVRILFGARNVGPTFGGSLRFDGSSFTRFGIGVAAGDRLGSVLAAKDFDGDGRDDLAMGIPLKNIRQLTDAGAVFVQYSDQGPLIGKQQFWEQNAIFGSTPDPLFGSPTRAGSQFGFSLAAGDFNGDGRADLAIGAPFETIRVQNGNVPVENAGEVDVIYGSSPSGLEVVTHAPQAWRESMPNSASQAAPGDQFGFSLTAWNFGRNQFRLVGNPPHLAAVQTADLAIGIPFKSVANILEAGGVQVIYGSFPVGLFPADGLTSANNQFWTESSPGMPTTPVFHDHFGKALY